MALTWRAPELRLSIAQGTNFHRELALAYERDDDTEPFDFTGWSGRLNLASSSGDVTVRFASGGEDGVITLTNAGEINLDLAAEYTTELAATVEVSGVIHAPLYGDLVLISPDDEPFIAARAVAEVTRTTA